MNKVRYHYAGHSYMNINMSYDANCWRVMAFPSKSARDEWIDNNYYNNGSIVACAISRRDAMRILKPTKWDKIIISDCGEVYLSQAKC